MPSSIGYLYTHWLAKSVLGSNEIALKIPSTLAMLGAVYFLFRDARELFGREYAFLACIFFCLEYNVVFAATDARPYAFALLASNLAILAFVRWGTRLGTREAILLGAAAAGILYFHYLFGSILPAFAITISPRGTAQSTRGHGRQQRSGPASGTSDAAAVHATAEPPPCSPPGSRMPS